MRQVGAAGKLGVRCEESFCILPSMKLTTVGYREPLWKEVPYEDPFLVARRLHRRENFTFLDSALAHEKLGRYAYIACEPIATLLAGPSGLPLEPASSLLDTLRLNHVDGLPPFQGGLAGYIAYETGRLLEPQLAERTPSPTLSPLQLHAYDVVASFDLFQRRTFIVSTGFPENGESARLKRAADRLMQFEALLQEPESLEHPGVSTIPSFASNFSRPEFEDAIARTREYVLSGDIFQANVSQRFFAPKPSNFDAFAFYERLRRKNAAPFAAFLDYGEIQVCSSSPERLVALDGRLAEARPIKGTRRRVPDMQVDSILKADLLASRKDRAENVMIVDLLRNDLSRVCKPGSVEVPVLCGLESFATVHHLVSVVTGELTPSMNAPDLLAAVFPGGSITGAPKFRAMEIIGEIEKVPRNIYCGSIGFIGFSGHMDFNIAIRTVTFHNDMATFHGGGGITARSEPSAEYDESIAKVQRIVEVFHDA
jgi:para-aminobenzoate synthetase component 1